MEENIFGMMLNAECDTDDYDNLINGIANMFNLTGEEYEELKTYAKGEPKKKMSEKDKSTILDSAIALEYALAQAEENNVDIGKALSHAQAILEELANAGFIPTSDSDCG